MKITSMHSSSRVRFLVVCLCLSFLLGSCGRPRVDTGITGVVMQCPDGPHHALNCAALFEQYKRDFSVGLKVFESIGAQVNVPVHTLIQLDTLTGELMLYRRNLCSSYNNCILTREEFVAEERKLMGLQYDLRKTVSVAQQQGLTQESLSGEVTDVTSGTSEGFGGSGGFGGFEGTGGNAQSEGSSSAVATIDPFGTKSLETGDSGTSGISFEGTQSSEGTTTESAAGAGSFGEQFAKIADALGKNMKLIMRGRKDVPSAPGGASFAPAAPGGNALTSQQQLVQQVDTVLKDLTSALQRSAPHKVGNKIVVGNVVDQANGYETPFSRYLATLIDTQLSVSAQHKVVQRQGFRGISVVAEPKQPKALAELSGAQMVLEGKQTVRPDGVAVQLTLMDGATSQPLASTSTLVPTGLIPASYPAEVGNAQQVKQTRVELQSLGSQAAGNLQVKVWTDRGGGASYYEGEKVFVHLRVTEQSYVRLFYIDAESNIVQIFPNAFHRDDRLRAGEEIIIPSAGYNFEFVVSPPFGVEQVAAIVSETPIPDVAGQQINGGRKLVNTSVRGLVSTLRSAPQTRSQARLAWDSVVLTTIARGRQAQQSAPSPKRLAAQ
jgi:hypothetical protein